uniref:Uncharacterized protein n=1 Tax=Romanomermis culicivorax TaxID=13658 RepID=A0A915KAQ1_ROMCU
MNFNEGRFGQRKTTVLVDKEALASKTTGVDNIDRFALTLLVVNYDFISNAIRFTIQRIVDVIQREPASCAGIRCSHLVCVIADAFITG